jgi:hypothetical protein
VFVKKRTRPVPGKGKKDKGEETGCGTGGDMIRKVKGGYVVKSHKGKKLSRVYKSKKAAARRLRQIEYFKHAK